MITHRIRKIKAPKHPEIFPEIIQKYGNECQIKIILPLKNRNSI
jgi:hypothetical protein